MATGFGRIARSVAIACFALYTATAGAAITSLFVFGDSLADAGNNAVVFDSPAPPDMPRTATPIPDPSFIPTFPYASDRYSNGPVWVEQLAASLGLSAQASLLGGTNFAFGGARTGPLGSSFPFSLLDQIGFFLAGTGGIAPSSALYVIVGGGNDARDAFEIAAGGGDPTVLISDYADNIGSILTQLETAGARKFLLANVPDIGKTPAIRALDAMFPGVATLATGLAMAMNLALAAELATLPADLLGGVRFLDLFGLVNAVVSEPGAFGITDVTSACAASLACIADPSGTFFWDGIHPTTAGHAALAHAALAVIPEPSTAVLAAVALAPLALRRRGRHAGFLPAQVPEQGA